MFERQREKQRSIRNLGFPKRTTRPCVAACESLKKYHGNIILWTRVAAPFVHSQQRTRASWPDEMQTRVALHIFSTGRVLKLNQHSHSLATRVAKLPLFSSPQCSLCDVSHVNRHPRSIRFSKTISGRQEALSIVKRAVRYFLPWHF